MTDEARVGAVILAGGRDRGALARATSQPVRALVPVRGRPMIAYVEDALAGAACVRRIVAVGPESLGAALSGSRVLPEGGDLLSNIAIGLSALDETRPALVLTCDIPLLTPAAVEDFVSRGLATGADLCYPIVARSVNDAQFPGMRRTYVRLREGRVTGGNMVLIGPGFFRRMEPHVASAYACRKKPLQLARKVGLGLVARLLLGRLAVGHVEARVGRLLGGSVRALLTEHPEIGADVDKPDDLRCVEAEIGERDAR